MVSLEKSITILKEIREYIIPLADEELFLLEKNILQNGCLDPLVVWDRKGGQLVLIDGHNRFKICQKNNVPFKIRKVSFSDIESVKIWMVENQMGRRNLTPDQMSYYRGLKYLALKKKKGGYENVKSKGQNGSSTSEFLGNNFNVSESTIKRDARFAEGLSIIGNSNPKLRMKILTGEAKVKKADVQILASARNANKLTFKNEADLYNKAKQIHAQVIGEVESRVKKIEEPQPVSKELEPAFLSTDDRLRRIKGMILSAVNKAINEKNSQAVKELKKLIDRLADILSD